MPETPALSDRSALLEMPALPARSVPYPRPPFLIAALRGLRGLCPLCGRGRLFAGYLKQVAACADCGEAYGHIRADDAPPWLTILVVGHIIVPLAVGVELLDPWPDWVAMVLWPAVALGLMLVILPRAKGLFLAAIWSTGAPGSETV